jgi:hypothetical protein
VVRLDDVELDNEARRPAAADAARLLVGLALGGATDELGEFLAPDPAVTDNRWTVACYEMGGLTPVAVREFRDPVEAVVMVTACPDEAHVAAELVASNENGLRWTAVWRTDDHVSFQLPTTETAESGEEYEEGEPAEELLAALDRWRMRLTEWSGRPASPAAEESEPEGEVEAETEQTVPTAVEVAPPPAPAPAPAPAHAPAATAAAIAALSLPTTARLQALEQRLTTIESTLGELSAELQAFVIESERREDESIAAVEQAIDVRFKVLAKVVQTALDRLGEQLVDDMKQISRETAQTKEVIERITIIDSDTRGHDERRSNVIDMRGSSA